MTATLGSRAHAAQAMMLRSDHNVVPETMGFEKVGSGAFRNAYLHVESDVVYKVDGMGRQWEYTNRGEVRTARILAKMEWNRVRIPKVALFTFKGKGRDKWASDTDEAPTGKWDVFIVAMEHIPGPIGRDVPNSWDHPGYTEFRDAVGWKRCGDMHGGNYKIHDDMFVPIDLGS